MEALVFRLGNLVSKHDLDRSAPTPASMEASGNLVVTDFDTVKSAIIAARPNLGSSQEMQVPQELGRAPYGKGVACLEMRTQVS